MMVERYRFFRWTPRTAWISFAYVIAVPALFGYMGYVTDVSLSSYGVEGAMLTEIGQI